jgi:leucyl aminopeptidase (aminopeptidase T)
MNKTNIGIKVLRQCLGVKKNEGVLIITDKGKLAEADLFFKAAQKITSNARLVMMKKLKEHGQEPPAKISQLMVATDVVLLVTSKSLSHTQARRQATRKGVRIASLPEISMETILRTLGADYRQIKKLTVKIANFLTAGKNVEITAKNGTQLQMSIKGRVCQADSGIYTQPGDWGNLPAGEACLAPLEGSTNGVAVIDGNSYIPEVPLEQNLVLEIKNGLVNNLWGGKAAQALEKKFKLLGLKARNIAELGVGTNPLAQVCASILEIEKVYGTVHIGLGNNLSYGGKVNVPFHSDGVILSPILKVDGKIILEKGKFTA